MRLPMPFLVAVCICHIAIAGAEERVFRWERMDKDLGETRFIAIAVDRDRIFAATPHTVYESTRAGQNWRERFQVPRDTTVSRIVIGGSQGTAVLVATDRGLYGSFDGGNQWTQVFRGVGEEETRCTQVAFHPQQPEFVLLGTRGGLFTSHDHGQHWQPLNAPLVAREIVDFTFDPTDSTRVYLVTINGFFVGNLTTGQWQHRFGMIASEQPAEETPTPPEAPTAMTEDVDPSRHHLSAVALDPRNGSFLYLASSKGLHVSSDGGQTWRPVTRSGLESTAISRLVPYAHSPLVIYAATTRGVARYEPDHDRWQILTQGFAVSRVNDLAVTPDHIWAATDEGLYRSTLGPDLIEPSPSAHDLLGNFVHEPTIGQVREVAIRYAEVHPHKIASWRTQARLRSVLPKLTFTSGTNLTDFRHWDTGANPDSLLRGKRDYDWNANASWDLASLIWSDDQTSIDSRSKLMVELRDEIVDEVTRTYFERRRLQVALLIEPPKDQHETLEKELRIQELTALIDGLTGGYFSKNTTLEHHEGSRDGKW